MSALAFAFQLLQLAPLLIQGVAGIQEAMDWGTEKVSDMVANGRDPTPEEWDELNARTDALRKSLHSDTE